MVQFTLYIYTKHGSTLYSTYELAASNVQSILIVGMLFTEPCLIASDFFSNPLRLWYQKKAQIFLITRGEIYS